MSVKNPIKGIIETKINKYGKKTIYTVNQFSVLVNALRRISNIILGKQMSISSILIDLYKIHLAGVI